MNALWDRGTVALRSGLLRVSAMLPQDLFRCGHRRWRPEMQFRSESTKGERHEWFTGKDQCRAGPRGLG
jgi:hypothetical protein